MAATGDQNTDISVEELVETELEKRLDIVLRRALMPDIERLKLCLLESGRLYGRIQSISVGENRLEIMASLISKIGNLRKSLDSAVDDAYSKIGGADRSLVDWVNGVKFKTWDILEKILTHAIGILKSFAKDSGASSYSISFGYYDLSVALNFNIK